MAKSPARKVLHLIHSLEMGGAQKVIINLVRHHDRSAFIPVVGSLRRAGTLEPLINKAGTDVVYFDKTSPLDIGCALRLREYIRANGISIVNAHNFSASLWGRIACAGLNNVAFVVTEHGRLENPSFKVRFFNRIFASGVDAIIAVSEETAEFIRMSFPYNAHKIHVVINGIDIPDEPGWSKSQLESEFGIPSDAPVIATLGAFTPVKDQALLINAVHLVLRELPDARLLLIGDGPLRSELEHLVDTLRMRESVVFAGERIDGPEILDASNVFCLSSRQEGTPIALLDAMARKCPMVLTKVGGIPYIVTDETEALLVPHGEPGLLAAALKRILNSGELAGKLASNALLRLRADFSAETMTRNTEEVYRGVSKFELSG